MSHTMLMPGTVLYGEGALEAGAGRLGALGARPLIVTDAMMERLGNVERLRQLLAEQHVDVKVFGDVNAEPTDITVRAGVRRFSEEGCDCLIALGGGSPIDTMKAIALSAAGGRDIDSFEKRPFEGAVCPMAALPTTAGTGSEATRFTIVTDTERDVKMLLGAAALIPDVAIIDPSFSMTAPPQVTAATGIDALCHAIEAHTSVRAQPISDTFALSAARRIFASLPVCYRCGDDVAARTQMAIAALEAGVAFNNSSVTVVHGMSRPLGALFHLPHGLSNAVLLEVCLRAIADAARPQLAELARACAVSEATDDGRAVRDLLGAVEKLISELSIPSLRALDIDERDFRDAIPKMARDAIASGSPANTRKELDAGRIARLYELAYTA